MLHDVAEFAGGAQRRLQAAVALTASSLRPFWRFSLASMKSMALQPGCSVRFRGVPVLAPRFGIASRPRSGTATRQGASAPTQDLEETEAAMKAAKDRAASSSSRAKSPVASELKGEAEDLKAKFLKIQAEVSSYKALSVVNQKLEDELTRLREVRSLGLHAHAVQRTRQPQGRMIPT